MKNSSLSLAASRRAAPAIGRAIVESTPPRGTPKTGLTLYPEHASRLQTRCGCYQTLPRYMYSVPLYLSGGSCVPVRYARSRTKVQQAPASRSRLGHGPAPAGFDHHAKRQEAVIRFSVAENGLLLWASCFLALGGAFCADVPCRRKPSAVWCQARPTSCLARPRRRAVVHGPPPDSEGP
jgi:hypothetical protein